MKALHWYRTKGLWWFRVCGYGIHYKNTRYHAELFSERMGYRKKLKLGRHRFGILRRDRAFLMTTNIDCGKQEEYRQYYFEDR